MAHILVCPQCGEAVEKGRPSGINRATDLNRANHRHISGRDMLCPVMTRDGYQPALPTRKAL